MLVPVIIVGTLLVVFLILLFVGLLELLNDNGVLHSRVRRHRELRSEIAAMRYMREQLNEEYEGTDVDSDMGPRRMSRQRTAQVRWVPKKPPKVPRNIPIIVPFLAVAPDFTVFLAIPDDTNPVPDMGWHPSHPRPSTTPAPDALLPAGASSMSLQGSISGGTRAMEALGLSPRFWSNPAVGDVGQLPKELAWTWVSLPLSLVPWWSEFFGEPSKEEGTSATSSRLHRFLLQQHNIIQLEKTLASMMALHDQHASTSAMVRSRSSCSLQMHRASRSFAMLTRTVRSTTTSPRATPSTPPLSTERASLQQDVIVELPSELPGSNGLRYTASGQRLFEQAPAASAVLSIAASGHSLADMLEES